MAEPLVALRGIIKTFPGVVANDSVNFDVVPGEIHALLGENGAGKSTLVKVLYGFYRPDAGQILIRGVPTQIHSPHDARRLGIGLIFQNFTLIPALSVVENVALFLPDLPPIVNFGLVAEKIRQTSGRYALAVDPQRLAGELSIGEQQKVEIVKLLLADARVLVLDEPTRVLAPQEVDGLLQVMRNLRDAGYAVVFITHKLHEALKTADRITVLRRGQVSGRLSRSEASEERMIALMFGTPPPRAVRSKRTVSQSASPLLELRGVSAGRDRLLLRDIDLQVSPGEILGVAGVSGNGQRELGDVVLGMLPCVSGTKILSGEDATEWSVASIREHGVAFIPEDPLHMGVIPTLSVLENMALGDLRRYDRNGGLQIDWTTVRNDLDSALHRFSLGSLPTDAKVGTLSGGNVQRLSLVKELSRSPRLIVALYPTRGLDVASATAARNLLIGARDAGAGVLLISEDLNELFELADRLIVLHRGMIAGTFRTEATSLSAVGWLMTGERGTHG